MSKKNIDRLFQEKFKEFDVKPDDKVWKNIQSQLQNEEDKPVFAIPFWLKLTGIAASLMLLFLLGNSVFNTEKQTQPTIVNTPKEKNNPVKDENNKTKSNTKPKDVLNLEKETTVNVVSNTYTITSPSNTTNTASEATNNKTNNKTALNTFNKNKSTFASNNNGLGETNSNNVSNSKNPLNTEHSLQSEAHKNLTNNTIANQNKQDKTTISLLENNNTSEVVSTEIEKEKDEEKPNAIEDAIAEQNTDDLNEKEEALNRWSINANAAPVYYNTFGEGSHIDEQFNTNNKSGEINTSYGIKVGYAINDKLTVRSGVNRLKLSYDTDDIIVYQNVSSNPKDLRNVSFNAVNSQSINIMSGDALFLQTNNSGLIRNVGLSQRISYYEVPLELEYALVNKKFNLNLIAGVSTFLLDNNELVSEFDGYKTKIGEANNINNVSFTTNFGVGLNYNFSKAVQFNVEPTFKYQINAYNNTSGSFNPYIVGIYTGLSYRF